MRIIGNMLYHEVNNVGFLSFQDWDGMPAVRAAFSTRLGGVSQQEFSTMNLAFGRGIRRKMCARITVASGRRRFFL